MNKAELLEIIKDRAHSFSKRIGGNERDDFHEGEDYGSASAYQACITLVKQLDEKLVIGEYTISADMDRQDSAFIQHKDGEGMSIGLKKIWEHF